VRRRRTLAGIGDDADHPELGLSRPAGAGAALALRTSYKYDGNGNRTKTTDPKGRFTTATYDGLNRLLLRQLPMGVFESRQYDGEGHVIGSVDVRGIERQATFDTVGRPIQDVLRPATVLIGECYHQGRG
jgi:YD repeat-containing protein